MAEAARNLSCVGAEPLAVTDNLNFPSPDTPTGYWQLAMACRGLSEACRVLDTPVTGGNVSLYNETRRPDGSLQPIHPTPVVGMVGLVHDLDHVTGLGWQAPGDRLWLLGMPLAGSAEDGRLGLAASSYLESVHGLATGRPPLTDLSLERAVQGLLRQGIAAGLVASAHDLSDGGLAVAAAEACIASGLGAIVELPSGAGRLDRLLFAEGGARVLISLKPEQEQAWQELLATSPPPGPAPLATPIGRVAESATALSFEQDGTNLLSLAVEELRTSFEDALPRRLAATD